MSSQTITAASGAPSAPQSATELPASESVAAPSQAKHRSVTRTRWYIVLGFMSPFIIGFGLFVLYPVVMVFYYSFTNFKQGSLLPVHFVGLQNYASLLTGSASQTFWISIKNTLWMVVVLVPAETIWAILTATLINTFKRSAKIYRTILFLPAMAPVVAGTLSWIIMMNPAGPVNQFLARIGIHGPLWFGDPNWTKPTLVMMTLWMIGNLMVIFSAALLDVPKSLYEAAEMDGAGVIQRFISVTLPSITPVIFFAVVTEVIYTFQYFTQAYVVSTAGHANLQSSTLLGYPQNSLFFYTTGIYQQGFNFFKTNVASAMAVLLFIVIFLITLIFIRGSRNLIYYQGEN